MGKDCLVFAMHGEFHWPPIATGPKSNNKKLGKVEIYYRKIKKNKYAAFLVWRPENNVNNYENPVGSAFNDKDLESFLGPNPEEMPRSIWIKPNDNGQQSGKRLVFRGAFLFTQQHRTSENDTPVVLRWPLIPSCKYSTAGQRTYSELIVGQDKNSNFRFSFNIPTPFDQTKLLDKFVSAFPCSAVFSPNVKSLESATNFETLVGGPIETVIKDASFEFATGTRPSSRLGDFHFAPKTDADLGRKKFATYEDNVADTSRFWSALSSGWSSNGCIPILKQMGLPSWVP